PNHLDRRRAGRIRRAYGEDWRTVKMGHGCARGAGVGNATLAGQDTLPAPRPRAARGLLLLPIMLRASLLLLVATWVLTLVRLARSSLRPAVVRIETRRRG